MAGYIVVSLIAGLLGAYGMYLLCTEKERKDHKAYDRQLQIAQAVAETATRRADACVNFLKVMNDTIKHNRDELDVLVPEFTKLKDWSYGNVRYLRKEKNVEKKTEPSAPVQERVQSEN